MFSAFSRGRRAGRWGAFLVALALASPAAAFDALRFTLQPGESTLQTALERASLLRAARDEGVTDAFEIFTIARAEYGQLIGIFYEAGFYAPEISVLIDGREAADISPLAPPTQIGTIEVRMTPGPAFVFARAEVAPVTPTTELPEGFARGAPARSRVIRDATEAAISGWRDDGHAQVDLVDQEITARHPANELDAILRIAPGPQLRFGELRPRGQNRTRRARIVKIAGLPEGEVYSPQALEQAAARLRRTGTFSSVALRDAEAANPDGTLDIEATLVEAPRRRLGLGIEYDTEAGLQLTGFWLHRNLLGGAERFRVEGAVGGLGARSGNIDYRIGTEFSRPATFTPDTTLNLGAVFETEREDDFEAIRLRLDAGLEHRYSDTLTFGGGIGLLLERADFGPGLGTRRDYRVVLAPFFARWDLRDSTRAPTRGYYLAGDLTPFLGISDADSGVRSYADLRAYRGFGEDGRVVLAGRAQLGAVFVADLEDTPRDFLFYSGGSGTVRGQPFRALGVTTNGVRSGGQGLAALSAEARVRATDTIGVVGFADAGYIWEGAFTGDSDWHAGAGVGLRYDTAIGPLRLDVGFPVAGDTGSGVQLYIGLGHTF